MAPQLQPKLQPQQQTASNSDSISDQQPVRTRISLPTLLKPMLHAIHPNPSMLKYIILIETRNPSPLWTRRKPKQNRSGSKTKKTSLDLPCAVVGCSLTGQY
jgi:hypothetical protein